MKSKLFFFSEYNNYLDFKNLLPEFLDPYWIITDSHQLYENLKTDNIEVEILGQLIPEYGPQAEEIFEKSKKIYKKYLDLFNEIKMNEISLISGFDHSFHRKINLLIKIETIFKQKKNVIFIFEGKYSPVYFSILKLSQSFGYSTDLKIGFIKNKKITYFSNIENDSKITNNKFKIRRALKFIRNNYSENSKFINFNIGKIILKNFLIIIKILIHKFLKIIKIDSTKIILKKIKKKLKNNNSSEHIFFITASRLDLFFRPFENVFDEMKKENIKFKIISSDFSTDVVLHKNKVQHFDFFEEMKSLIELVKNSDHGKSIREKTNKIILENKLLSGIEDLNESIVESFYQSAALVIICEFIIKHLNVKSIIISPTGEMLENIAIEISHKMKIPNYSFLPGIINPEPIISNWLHSDNIFVSGESMIKSLASLGYKKNKLILTGEPKYDFFKTLNFDSKLKFAKEYQLDINKKLIVIVMSRWHENDEIWMSNLIKFVNQNNFEIIIKIHPFYKIKLHNESENKIRKIQEICENMRYIISYDMEMYKILHIAELVITDYSNAGIEAAFLDKPIISLNLIKENSDNLPQRLDKYGAAIYVDEYSRLEVLILEILNEKMYLEELKIGRTQIVNMFNYRNDGLASKRIINILKN